MPEFSFSVLLIKVQSLSFASFLGGVLQSMVNIKHELNPFLINFCRVLTTSITFMKCAYKCMSICSLCFFFALTQL
jgi:hypothetical protein